MSHELLYTSAQHGLKPGSYGFCTVMATEGLSKALQDRLESLSGYEHAFALTDRRASMNPVNYSHLIVTVANQRLHLLSRIADAGADYSGRSNKLAHHLVLRPTELPEAGPAAALATPEFCLTSFDGTPRTLPHRVLPTASVHRLAICTAWKAACGDAGWAGYLAEQTLQNSLRPVTLIYPAECDVLPLVVEAMCLLPPDRQWRTTFSTFFSKLPAGVECQWRFVLDGTPAADQARRNLQSPPIDLKSPGKIPREGPLVEAARTGQMPVSFEQVAPASTNAAPKAARSASVPASREAAEQSADTYRLGSMPVRPPSMATGDDDLFAPRGMSPKVLSAAIGGGLAVVVLGIGIAASMMGGSTPPMPAPPIPEKATASVEAETAPAIVQARNKKKEGPKEPVDTPTVQVTNTVPEKATITHVVEKPATFEEITKDIRAKGAVLSLPKREQGVATPVGEHELCKIFVKKPGECDLKLVTTEVMDDGQPRIFLARDNTVAEGTEAWIAITRAKNKALQTIDEVPIGQFTLKDQSLLFEWKQAPDWTSPFGLLFCKLDVHAGSQKIECSLTKPIIKVADLVDLNHRRASMPIDIAAGTLSSVKFLRYDLELRMGDWSQSKMRMKADDLQTLRFELPGGDAGEKRVDLEFQFVPPSSTKDGAFNYRAYIYPTYLADPQMKQQWERITKRNDAISELEPTKEGFIIPDFKLFRKAVADRKKRATMIWAPVETEFKQQSREFKNVAAKLSPDERDARQKALNELQAKERYLHEAVTFGDETLEWINAMEKRFEEIHSKLEVRFTIYLEFLGESIEKVVLVETNKKPSGPENK